VERTDGAVTRERRFVRGPRLFLQERGAANAVVAEIVWNPAKPGGIGGLLKRRSGGTGYSFLNDAAGNVTAVVDSAQAVVASYRYDPFGRVESESGTLAQDFRFQSKFLDPRSGLSYFGFRWDAPGDGRWLTRDPLRERAGLNLYDYVGNDPLNGTDAWGLEGGPAMNSAYWGRYDDSAGICTGYYQVRDDSWTWKMVAGKTWAWIQSFIGSDRSDGTQLNEPGNSGSNGVRAESGGTDGSDGGPNAVVGVRG
jgi:RHS repeat-associated protein